MGRNDSNHILAFYILDSDWLNGVGISFHDQQLTIKIKKTNKEITVIRNN